MLHVLLPCSVVTFPLEFLILSKLYSYKLAKLKLCWHSKGVKHFKDLKHGSCYLYAAIKQDEDGWLLIANNIYLLSIIRELKGMNFNS